MAAYESLPYRPCVGMAVFNRKGRVFVGRRIDGPEHVDAEHAWQMPQGGIDRGEDPWRAALRELYEETNIRSVEKLGEIEDELCYDIPREIVGQAWGGKYRGQCQKWSAALHRQGQRDRHRASRRRPRPGIRGLALGAARKRPPPDRAVQTAGLRAGGRGIRQACEAVNRALAHQVAAVIPAQAGTYIPEPVVMGPRFRGDDSPTTAPALPAAP
jgi:8-oxo-dGTP pyrophosphatase MutT (NUDIX family)